MALDKVTLSMSLMMSKPSTVSISHPERSESLTLVATVRQERSPYPDRALTLLTKNSVLDKRAFWKQSMGPPTDIKDDEVKIYMHPLACCMVPSRRPRMHDMRQEEDLEFITVPPLGQGSIDVTWSLAPEILLGSYWREGTLEKPLENFTVGQRFKIGIGRSRPIWWTWESLQHDLKSMKFSRWSLPRDLSIIREVGQDEEDKVNRGLVDVVYGLRLAFIANKRDRLSRPDSNVQGPPKVKDMRREGWVFGEPAPGLEIVCDHTVTFEFVE